MKVLKVELEYTPQAFLTLIALGNVYRSANLLNPAFCVDQAQNGQHIFKQCGGWADV